MTLGRRTFRTSSATGYKLRRALYPAHTRLLYSMLAGQLTKGMSKTNTVHEIEELALYGETGSGGASIFNFNIEMNDATWDMHQDHRRERAIPTRSSKTLTFIDSRRFNR